jgi:hypothetical protein
MINKIIEKIYQIIIINGLINILVCGIIIIFFGIDKINYLSKILPDCVSIYVSISCVGSGMGCLCYFGFLCYKE